MPLPINYTDSTPMVGIHPQAHNDTNAVVNDLDTRVTSLETSSGGAPVGAKYLTTEANATLTDEVVVGLTPGGELAGPSSTWSSPIIRAIHSGTSHASILASAIDAAAIALNAHVTSSGIVHSGIQVAVQDAAGHYVATNVEDVLAEIAAGGIGSNGLSAYEIAVVHGFVGDEQDWLDSLQAPEGSTSDYYLFHWRGPLVADQAPDPKQIRRDSSIVGLELTLSSASSTEASLVIILLNGVQQGSPFSIGAGEDTVVLPISPPIAAVAGQRLQVRCTIAGAGATGLVTEVRSTTVGSNPGPPGADGRDAMGRDGWIEAQNAWTFASTQTVTCSGSEIALLASGGARLRWKINGTGNYRYGYAKSVAGSTLTKFTTTSGDDFATNITNFAYSFADAPFNFPSGFNYVSTVAGQTATTATMRFKVSGRTITWYLGGFGGTSSSSTIFTATSPAVAAFAVNEIVPALNGTSGTSYGSAWASMAAASNVMAFAFSQMTASTTIPAGAGTYTSAAFGGPIPGGPGQTGWIANGGIFKIVYGRIEYEY